MLRCLIRHNYLDNQIAMCKILQIIDFSIKIKKIQTQIYIVSYRPLIALTYEGEM